MREIKFRGKRVDNGEWVYGYYYIFEEDHRILDSELNTQHIVNVRQIVFNVIPQSVGQFTGLHDKNGVDIYEGDILEDIEIPDDYYKAVWENYGFDFERMNDGELMSNFDDIISFEKVSKVIGNIYEHPHLIS